MLGGKLLIAQPQCNSDYFKESVVLCVDHTPQGSWGLVVNKPTQGITVKEIAKSVDLNYDGPEHIYMSGPVEPRAIHILHTPDVMVHNTIALNTGVATSSSIEMLDMICKGKGPSKWKLCMGVTSWGGGQLDGEMAGTPPWTPQHKWLNVDCMQHLLDYNPEMLWKTCVKLAIEEATSTALV